MSELDKPIGTKEPQKLAAGSVKIEEVTIAPAKEGSKAKLVTFHCKHPDREEQIKISNIMVKKTQGNNINIKRDALWYNTDEDGNIRKTSNLAEVMRFYKKLTLKEFENSFVSTEVDTNGFLAIKAY